MNARERRWGVRRRYQPKVVFPGKGWRGADKHVGAGYGGPGMPAGATYAKKADAVAHASAMVDKGHASYVNDYGTAGDPYTDAPEIVWMGSPALHDLRKGNPTMVKFYDIEYAADQEPEVDGAYRNDPFATVMGAKFQLQGAELASALGVQRRVLARKLESMPLDALVYAVQESKQGKAIERAFAKRAKQTLEQDIDDAVEDPGVFHVKGIKASFSEDLEFAEAKTDPRSQSATFYLEFDVIGDWESRDG